MKTALRALVLIVVVSGIAGVYFLFGPEHAPAGGMPAYVGMHPVIS